MNKNLDQYETGKTIDGKPLVFVWLDENSEFEYESWFAYVREIDGSLSIFCTNGWFFLRDMMAQFFPLCDK
jgi:hypothetical protein